MDTKFAVAVHTLLFISESPEPKTSETISQTLNTNASYVRKILSGLVKAGMITSATKSKDCCLLKQPGEILLSDIYLKQGRTTEAREYLESLRPNYPGKEKEIFAEIDSRLARLGGKTAGSAAKGTGKQPATKARNRNNANSSADNKAASAAGKRSRGNR